MTHTQIQRPLRLRGAIRNYAWGSHRAIAELLGAPSPTPEPQAELWLGAHPQNPSRVEVGGEWIPLDDWIQRSPRAALGSVAEGQLDPPILPFLLKVLAAERPLSVQAHPDRRQAEIGFRREQELGVADGAPHRSYRDAQAKPEILYALTPFVALSGFRAPRDAHEALAALELGARLPGLEALSREGAAGFRRLLREAPVIGSPAARELVQRASEVAKKLSTAGAGYPSEYHWVTVLCEAHPADPAVLAPLFLNLVELSPGEVLFTGAGVLHAYLAGSGIELMTPSDNVLRGGLTAKHVDREELLRVLRFVEQPPRRLAPRGGARGVQGFLMPDVGLGLAHLSLQGDLELDFIGGSAEILLCTAGTISLRRLGASGDEDLELSRGDAIFVPAAGGPYRLSGQGEVFRGGIGLPRPSAVDTVAAARV